MKMREVHRLPLGFGPVKIPEVEQMAKVDAYEFCYETDPALLAKLNLPQGTQLASNKVYVSYHKYNGVNLLAGRGYNTIIIAFDAKRAGKEGKFIALRITNDMFTMIDGRYGDFEFSDLYAEILDPVIREDGLYFYATEYESCFLEMFTSDFAALDPEDLAKLAADKHHTTWLTDAHELTAVERVDCAECGVGRVVFKGGSWEDMPGFGRIASFMQALPVKSACEVLHWEGALEIGEGGEL